MNLATHAGLIAGTSVLTIASTGTAGDLDSVIDGIINDSATISGDDAYSMEGLFIYGYTNTDADDFGPGVGETSLGFEGHTGGLHWEFDYNFTEGFYGEAANSLNDYGFYYKSDAGWGAGMGQFRSWANKANNVEAKDTLMMGNSIVGDILWTNGGYGDSAFAWYEADQFRGGVMMMDSDIADESDMHYRVEFIAMGDWDDTDNFTSYAGDSQVLAFGFGGFESAIADDGVGGVGINILGNTIADIVEPLINAEAGFDAFDDELLSFAASHEMTNFDVTYKNNGFGAHAAFGTVEIDGSGSYVDADLGIDESVAPSIEADFMTLQLSYFINDDWQLYATYEEVDLDTGVIDFDLAKDDNLIIGANTWYSDDCKVTIEYEDETFNAGAGGDSRLAAQVQFTF